MEREAAFGSAIAQDLVVTSRRHRNVTLDPPPSTSRTQSMIGVLPDLSMAFGTIGFSSTCVPKAFAADQIDG